MASEAQVLTNIRERKKKEKCASKTHNAKGVGRKSGQIADRNSARGGE